MNLRRAQRKADCSLFRLLKEWQVTREGVVLNSQNNTFSCYLHVFCLYWRTSDLEQHFEIFLGQRLPCVLTGNDGFCHTTFHFLQFQNLFFNGILADQLI